MDPLPRSPPILNNINGCIHGSVKGFYEKYFEDKPWISSMEKTMNGTDGKSSDDRWANIPSPLSDNTPLEWFRKYSSVFSRGRGTYQTSLHGFDGGLDTQHNPSIFLSLSRPSSSDDSYSWSKVQVVGEISDGLSSSYKEGFLRLCGDAKGVFWSQPARKFLHGFYIYESFIELWVFDRSGLYSCTPFNIHNNPSRFFNVLDGYTMFNDEELGINTFIKEDRLGRFVTFIGDKETESTNLYLEQTPIARPGGIVCVGTTCYRARMSTSERWDFVVKFVWRLEKKRPEENLLKLIKERHVWGVIHLFSHQDIGNTNDLRQGLQFQAPRKFMAPMGQLSPKTMTIPFPGNQQDNSFDHGVNQFTVAPEAAYNTGTAGQTYQKFDNRILSCLVIGPVGRPLHEFKSVLELLHVFRDAIKAHKSLYLDGKILHQDISKDNIIITEPEDEGYPTGMLIDLDVAKDLEHDLSRPGELIGTKIFMAVGVLKATPHTYRHDLESFLYVFLWIAICHRTAKLPQASSLQHWSSGGWDELAKRKINDMGKERFAAIISEFSSDFRHLQGLAESLRELLFPMRHGLLFTGTEIEPKEIDGLYDGMIRVFDLAIAQQVPSL